MADSDTATVEGIDADDGHRVVRRRTSPGPGRRSPSTSSPAATPTSPTRSPTPPAAAGCCAGRRSATCSPPPTTWAASTASSPRSADTDVPVPPAIGLCTDDSVNGAPVLRHGLRRRADRARRRRPPRRSPPSRARTGPASRSSTCWPRIHAVDVDAVGLGDLGRQEGYIERQLKRWHGQWEKSKTRELPAIDEVHDRAGRRASPSRARPRSSTATTASTTACSTTTATIPAVLDWELCTLGDPLADVGPLLMYWTEPGDDARRRPRRPDHRRGLPTSAELLERYAEALRPRPLRHRLLRRLRLLEAGLHRRGRATPATQAGAMGGADASALVEVFTAPRRPTWPTPRPRTLGHGRA